MTDPALKKEIQSVVQLRRTNNFQADVIRRYAKFLSELDAMPRTDSMADVEKAMWRLKLDLVKMLE